MEEVVLCTVSVKDKKGDISGDILKEVRNNANTVLKIITGWMHASTYFKGITQLLEHPEGLVKRKVSLLFCSLIMFFKANFAPLDCPCTL